MLVFPLKKIWISNDCPGHGYNAYDLGWWDYDRSMPDDTGRNPLLYAMGEGIVLGIDDTKPDEPDGESYGNTVIIGYYEGYVSLYAHVKRHSFLVRPGDRVSALQPVCRMGNSGNSTGNHLHLELCEGNTFRSHRGMDLLKTVTATDWHVVDEQTLRDYPVRVSVLSPGPKDVSRSQLHVIRDDLRIREEPSLEARTAGFALKGHYDVDGIEETDMKWARTGRYYMSCDTDSAEYLAASFVPSERDTSISQVKVEIDDLRIRESPSLKAEVIGWCPPGVYDVDDLAESDGLKWLGVCGAWIALVDGVEYLPGEGEDIRSVLYEAILSIRDICEDALSRSDG